MKSLPNTIAYRQWAEGVLSGQVIAASGADAELVLELLDYITLLEGLVDRGCGMIDAMGYPEAEAVLERARANEEYRRNQI